MEEGADRQTEPGSDVVRKRQTDLETNTVSVTESSDTGIPGGFCEAGDK